MVGVLMPELPSCVVTFSVSCELVPAAHLRLVQKVDGYWDYAGSTVLKCAAGGGADLSVWSCSLTLPVKDEFEYRYALGGSDSSTSFLNLSPILSMIPKEPKVQRNDGNFGVLLDVEVPTSQQSPLTYLTFTLDYPDYYMSSPKHPRLGLQFPKAPSSPSTSVYTSTTSLWAGASKITDSTHALASSSTFTLLQPFTLSHVQFDIHSLGTHVGVVTVLSSQLTSFHGVLTSPIVDSTSSVIGNVTFHYAIATPFSHPTLGFKSFSRKSFPAKPTLVGHRGSGAEGSRTQIQGSPRSHIRENTLLSFEKAGTSGAHFVEFDVHLTSDLVPVIYHDFTVSHSAISAVPIHSLTLEEFKKIGSKAITKTNSLTNLLAQKQQEPSPSPSSSHSPHDPSSTVPEPIFDNFPTLRETLTKVPPNIGFNIEIKYPIKDELEKYNIRPVDRNKYIDCILWDVFEYAKDREIVFSSFDPDICVILSRKQPKYPVLFLTEMGYSRLRSDPRCNSPEASIHFATSHGLQGLVCPAAFLLNNSDVVPKIKKAGLVVATWGRDNNNTVNVDKQLELGVNGIIVDHVAYIAQHWRKVLAN